MKFLQVLSVILVIETSDLYCGVCNAELHSDKRKSEKWVWGISGGLTNKSEKWIWGISGGLTNSNDTKDTQLEETTTTQPKGPILRNISKPQKLNASVERRISEVKCFEYMSELQHQYHRRKVFQAEFDLGFGENEQRGFPGIGGRDTYPGEFPHMGALGWWAVAGTWLFKCGSSLLSPKFLLTAAHCSQTTSTDYTVTDTKPKIVRLGDKNIIDDVTKMKNLLEVPYLRLDVTILRLIVHPQYSPPRKYFDIAVIELVTEVEFNRFIQPVCLWTKPDTSSLGTTATLTGWGAVDTIRLQTWPELQAVSVDIIDTNLCNNLLRPTFNRHFNGVEPTQICAGVLVGGADSCQGDSGGPLQVKIWSPFNAEESISYAIGVTSFGFGCARANTPGVYTRVSSFIDWIESIVWT